MLTEGAHKAAVRLLKSPDDWRRKSGHCRGKPSADNPPIIWGTHAERCMLNGECGNEQDVATILPVAFDEFNVS